MSTPGFFCVVTPAAREREDELRRQAASSGHDEAKYAASVLADFYESTGQPSRAACWRSPRLLAELRPESARSKRVQLGLVPDLISRPETASANVDPRRNAMVWLLVNVGEVTAESSGLTFLTRRAIAFAFALSVTTVLHVSNKQWRRIRQAAKSEARWQTLAATRRLAATGALRGEMTGHEELPPPEWPRRRRSER